MDISLHFTIEKETKGAVRFKEVNADGSEAFDPKIGTLYVRKSAMGGKLVQNLTMTVKAA